MRRKEVSMDIAGLSTSMAMSSLKTDWGMKMMSKAMDTAEIQGAELAQMIQSAGAAQMELSVNPYVGGQFDMSV